MSVNGTGSQVNSQMTACQALNEHESDLAKTLTNASGVRENKRFEATAFPTLYDDLKRHWQLAVGSSAWDSWFDRLFNQHNETGRHYHTCVHLMEMLHILQILLDDGRIDEQVDSSRVLRLATFFHDAVYNPQSSQNEKDSDTLFHAFATQSQLDESTKNAVSTLILATEKHEVIPSVDVSERVQMYFLDMDMAVLGKEEEAYLVYAGLIRKEYSHVPKETFCEKRAEVLESFLSRPIFQSLVFVTALDASARQNLRTEIGLLRKGIIPGE